MRPAERSPDASEAPALDIGGDTGALVVYADEGDRGREVEITRIGGDTFRVHTVIHERRLGERVLFAGVFPELAAGSYRLEAAAGRASEIVTIVGGEVTEADVRRLLDQPNEPR